MTTVSPLPRLRRQDMKNELQEIYHYSHYKSKPDTKASYFSLRGKNIEMLLYFGVLQTFRTTLPFFSWRLIITEE